MFNRVTIEISNFHKHFLAGGITAVFWSKVGGPQFVPRLMRARFARVFIAFGHFFSQLLKIIAKYSSRRRKWCTQFWPL